VVLPDHAHTYDSYIHSYGPVLFCRDFMPIGVIAPQCARRAHNAPPAAALRPARFSKPGDARGNRMHSSSAEICRSYASLPHSPASPYLADPAREPASNDPYGTRRQTANYTLSVVCY
jgi:hypothetical protein